MSKRIIKDFIQTVLLDPIKQHHQMQSDKDKNIPKKDQQQSTSK